MRTLLVIFFCFSVVPVVAQHGSRVAASSISSSNTDTGKLYYGNRHEPPRAIEFEERTVTASYFLANVNHFFNIPAELAFKEEESNTDNLGMRHRLLQQYYNGIPVEGMGYRVHERDGFVTSANGRAVRKIHVDTEAILSEAQAFDLAIKYLNSKDTTAGDGRKLIVSKGFTFTPESFFLAFQFDIDVSLVERWRISIDARNGNLLNKVSLVNSCLEETAPPLPYGTGTGLTNYYGSKTVRVETFENGSSRLAGLTDNGVTIGTYDFRNANILALIFGFYTVYDFYSPDNTYNSAYQKPAVSVQWAAEQAYNYYFRKHGRNSYDNNGGEIKSYVHVGVDVNNAFWTGKVLAFGDGSNNTPLVELDVVSHELTHGVTQYEARLQYYNEPGALNESFSDILAKTVEFDAFGDTATWQMARHVYDGGLRDLSNPNLKEQPDTYMGDMWYTGYEDNGGVHYNSGVQNFWFYLLCEGGTGINDHEMNYSVESIGMETAANIAYRNLTEYLGSTSDYLDSRIGSLLATADLHGKNSTIYQEVANAWDAVGVIDEPIITSLELYDITATTVKIKGSLLPRGDTVTYHFEYGTTPDLGSSSAVFEYTGTVEGIIRGLQSETPYYLRLVATNENGSSFASTQFTTISLEPLVKIKHTVDVSETKATLRGQVNPNSLPASFYFEYGMTPALGLATPIYPLPDTTEFLNVSATVIDLQPRQTYYYRLVATNDFASATTESVSFFTAVMPVISAYSPAAAAPGTEVTITGQNFNVNGENNHVSFGATRADVLSSSSTEIRVKVPGGASLGPISLLDSESGLTAKSIREFVPTFTGEFEKSHLQLRVGVKDIAIYQPFVQDMDGDNRPDIVGGYYQGFLIYQNVSQGGDITSESFIRNTYPAELSGDLYAVDFDGNGLKDIVGSNGNGLRIYPNLSVPGFIFFGVPVDLPTGYLSSLSFDDFDQDGHIDIAYTRGLSGGDSSLFTVIRNENPKGIFSADNFQAQYTKVLPYYVFGLYRDDLNNDGKPDLICGTRDSSYVRILGNNSNPGSFVFDEIITQQATGNRWARYLSQDLNQDGWKDIACHARYDDVNLVLLQNTGTSPTISLASPVAVLKGYIESRVSQGGDIDGDGRVDLLVGINNGDFIFLRNQTAAGENLSASSFEVFETFGSAGNTTSWQSGITINDLNGDGRPEVINTNSYNQYPYDGFQMEIWQNAPGDCPDPSLIELEVSNYTAEIVLPSNTTLDQFQIEYRRSGSIYWNGISSTTLQLWSGYAYQLRARAQCYLGFTDYYYIDFIADCVDTNNFFISNITANSVSLTASNLGSLEVQYSLAGKDQWTTVPQYSDKISNLLHGSTYEVRFRGRCNSPTSFKYEQFTTLCPKLSSLTVAGLMYDRATVSWTSSYSGNAILEYSADNATWTLIDESRTIFALTPARQYFIRGRLACTDINSDFIYTSFTTPCPSVSTVSVDNVTPFSATIGWEDESDSESYTVSYSMHPGGTVTTVETSSRSFRLDGLIPGTQYSVEVAPQCLMTKDFRSAVFSTVCYVPFDLSVNATTQTTAELSWDDHFSALPYAIDYSIAGSNLWLTTGTALTNILLAELRPGTEYEARVHINCLSQTAPFASVRFETNLYAEASFSPNPTDDKITIYPSENLIGRRFRLHDNTGRVLALGEIQDYTIDLSGFSAGIYTLNIDGSTPIRIMKK